MALRNDFEQPSTFWRADIHRKAGQIDESYKLAFDWEWWNRLRAIGAQFHRIDGVLSHYYFTETNLTSRGGQQVIDEMARVTETYASPRVAAVYRFMYQQFDLKGDLDVSTGQLPRWRRIRLRVVRGALRWMFGPLVIDNYNWNWASKQVRGVVWFK
jgi:hypothetical protein